ncbi:hypothetical protein LSTR_LSTR012299 [Laodelphax striatellus]|uniref:Receptor ligand binding region domain-containing protein n=1 Tax=Laodelphax striatellus TaxID=195883 RepID=A0A482WZV9_LAOST|nr:hypothetical protein LSTR_LSTR012299 [Laodelphax striatellus]
MVSNTSQYHTSLYHEESVNLRRNNFVCILLVVLLNLNIIGDVIVYGNMDHRHPRNALQKKQNHFVYFEEGMKMENAHSNKTLKHKMEFDDTVFSKMVGNHELENRLEEMHNKQPRNMLLRGQKHYLYHGKMMEDMNVKNILKEQKTLDNSSVLQMVGSSYLTSSFEGSARSSYQRQYQGRGKTHKSKMTRNNGFVNLRGSGKLHIRRQNHFRRKKLEVLQHEDDTDDGDILDIDTDAYVDTDIDGNFDTDVPKNGKRILLDVPDIDIGSYDQMEDVYAGEMYNHDESKVNADISKVDDIISTKTNMEHSKDVSLAQKDAWTKYFWKNIAHKFRNMRSRKLSRELRVSGDKSYGTRRSSKLPVSILEEHDGNTQKKPLHHHKTNCRHETLIGKKYGARDLRFSTVSSSDNDGTSQKHSLYNQEPTNKHVHVKKHDQKSRSLRVFGDSKQEGHQENIQNQSWNHLESVNSSIDKSNKSRNRSNLFKTSTKLMGSLDSDINFDQIMLNDDSNPSYLSGNHLNHSKSLINFNQMFKNNFSHSSNNFNTFKSNPPNNLNAFNRNFDSSINNKFNPTRSDSNTFRNNFNPSSNTFNKNSNTFNISTFKNKRNLSNNTSINNSNSSVNISDFKIDTSNNNHSNNSSINNFNSSINISEFKIDSFNNNFSGFIKNNPHPASKNFYAFNNIASTFNLNGYKNNTTYTNQSSDFSPNINFSGIINIKNNPHPASKNFYAFNNMAATFNINGFKNYTNQSSDFSAKPRSATIFPLHAKKTGRFYEEATAYFQGADKPAWPVKKEAILEGDVILGGLMMVHEREESITCGPIMPEGGVQALEAMLYTLDVLNARKDKKFTLGAHILDDCDKDTYGLEMAVDFIKGRKILKILHGKLLNKLDLLFFIVK